MRIPEGRIDGLGRLRGLGSTLSDAAAKLAAAGYANPQCETQVVNSPAGAYTQNVCSANGIYGGMDAGLIASMSPQQLKDQLATEAGTNPFTNSTGPAPLLNDGTSASQPNYFSWSNSGPGVTVSNLTGPSLTTPTPSPSPATKSTTTTPAGTATQSTGSSLSTLLTQAEASTSSSSIIPGVPDTYLYVGGAAVLLLFLMKGGK